MKKMKKNREFGINKMKTTSAIKFKKRKMGFEFVLAIYRKSNPSLKSEKINIDAVMDFAKKKGFVPSGKSFLKYMKYAKVPEIKLRME